MCKAQLLTTTATRVPETNKAEEAQAESLEGSQVSAEDLQADLDESSQMVSEGSPTR